MNGDLKDQEPEVRQRGEGTFEAEGRGRADLWRGAGLGLAEGTREGVQEAGAGQGEVTQGLAGRSKGFGFILSKV